MERVGFIGLGDMGAPLARHLGQWLQTAGGTLTVFDLNTEAIAALVAEGATAASSVADLAAQVDVVITVLPNSPDVQAVVLGPGGVAEHAKPGTLVIDMSTIDPASTDALHAALLDRGIGFADAPIGRTVAFAERGEALFMVGASDNDFGRARPLFEAMGSTTHHCGAPGTGIRTKLVNNFIAIGVCQINAEAIALSTRFGLDVAQTLEIVNGTTATNGHLTTAWPNKTLKGDIDPGFKIALAHKDIGLVVDAADKGGVPVLAGAAVRQALGIYRNTAFAEKDFSAMLDAVCAQAKIDPPRL